MGADILEKLSLTAEKSLFLNFLTLFNKESLHQLSLMTKSHEISFKNHVTIVITNQTPLNCQIFENIRDFIKKYFHLNSSAVCNSSPKNQSQTQIRKFFTKKPFFLANLDWASKFGNLFLRKWKVWILANLE